MENEYIRLTHIIHTKARSHPKRRFLVAIAGAPGSGKTTLAREAVRRLNDPRLQDCSSSQSDDPRRDIAVKDGHHPQAVLVSMDGFHLPRSTLDTLPNREEAYIRRGAPWTFDVIRFVGFIESLRAWADGKTSTSDEKQKEEEVIYAPTFSHKTKDPVEHGLQIPRNAQILIIEGNYLLLDEDGWRDVADMVDLRVYVDADLNTTRDRVAKRHVLAGIEKTLEDGYARVDANDALNGRLIKERLVEPDLVVRSVDDDVVD
jgi:pantothenate kinase